MILVDTSVWIDHLRAGNGKLRSLLENAEVLAHPFVVGELACGTLRNREEVLTLLQALPEAEVAEHEEVMRVVERERLYGQGLGWIDAHLLASARLSSAALWTLVRTADGEKNKRAGHRVW
ncbi:MAG TPA: type II toxin-antitoxin system VapC family toxin [bacterium]|nr:type II toxin-antitoxin system VapC family toxin [bacterium]